MEVVNEDTKIISDKSSNLYASSADMAGNQDGVEGSGEPAKSSKVDIDTHHHQLQSHQVVYVENDCHVYLGDDEKMKVNLVSDMCYTRDLIAAVWQARNQHMYTDLLLVCQDGQVAAHSFLLGRFFAFCDITFHADEECQLILLPDSTQKEVEIAVKDIYYRSCSNKLCQLLNIHLKSDPLTNYPNSSDTQIYVKDEEPSDRSKIAVKQLDDLMETEEKYPVMTLLGDLLQTDQKPLKISKTDNKPKMKKSTKEESSKRVYECKKCSYTARTKAMLSNHLKKHKIKHSNPESKKLPTIKEKRSYKCNHCDFIAQTVRDMTKHTTYNHKDLPKKYKCDKCNFATNYVGNVEKHMKKMHLNIPGEFACSKCPSTFYVLAKLKSHMVIHSDEKNYVCDECAAKFKRKDDLKCHMKIHLPDEIRMVEKAKKLTKECPTCHKMFEKKWKLERHQKVHQKDNMVSFLERSQVPIRWDGENKPITDSVVHVEEFGGVEGGNNQLPVPVQEFIVLTSDDTMVQPTDSQVSNKSINMAAPDQKQLLSNPAKYNTPTSHPISFN